MEAKRRTRIRWKPYFAPTPKRIRVIGDSFAAASIFVAGLNVDDSRVMIWCAVIGGIGKFISNFIGIEDGIK